MSAGFSNQEYLSEQPVPPPGESFWPRNRTQVSRVSCSSRRILYHCTTYTPQMSISQREAPAHHLEISSLMPYWFIQPGTTMIIEVLKIRVAQSKYMSVCMHVHAHTHTQSIRIRSYISIIIFFRFYFFFTSISFLLFLLRCFPPPLSHFLALFLLWIQKT